MTDNTVLLVDDNAEARAWLIDSVLRPEGYAFVEATNLSEARAHILAQPPQVIVLDAQLDQENGLALLTEYGLRYPFIVTTTQRSVDEMSAALEAGAVDVLVKPFEPQRLTRVLARTLRMVKAVGEQHMLREQVDRQAQEFNALYTRR
jgi:two-component system response regulator FlrC